MKKNRLPKALTKVQVLQGRGDLSPFLVHLTRSGNLFLWKDIYGGSVKQERKLISAKSGLENILDKKVIKAVSPFGYFNYKVPLNTTGGRTTNPGSKIQRKWLRSVCFTETPVEDIHFQMSEIAGRNLHFEPYGLAFWESFIRKKGGNPLFYFDSTNETIKESLLQFLMIVNDLKICCRSMKVLDHHFTNRNVRLILGGNESGEWSVMFHSHWMMSHLESVRQKTFRLWIREMT